MIHFLFFVYGFGAASMLMWLNTGVPGTGVFWRTLIASALWPLTILVFGLGALIAGRKT